MTKYKFKNSDDTTIDDIEQELIRLKKSNVNELPFTHLKKIAELLGAEYLTGKKSSGGASLNFKHPYLNGIGTYFKGVFSVHRIHGNKNNIKIRMNDYKSFLLPALLTIIEIKRGKGEKK